MKYKISVCRATYDYAIFEVETEELDEEPDEDMVRDLGLIKARGLAPQHWHENDRKFTVHGVTPVEESHDGT